MRTLLVSMTMCLGLLAAGIGHAQAPATAPAGSTAQCKDGSWYSGETKKGACRGHKGIQEWYGASGTAASNSETPKKSRSKKEAASETAAVAPATAAPAGATALCKDGSYFSGETRKGACRGHKGIKEWYGASAAPVAAATHSSMPMTPPAATPQAPAAPAPTAMPHATAASSSMRAAAPGGGAGQVWVNSGTKVYHCPNDRYYGKTKQGEYMSEADALAKGNHAARGKSCSQ